jgi:predicted transcriptional regulator
MQVPADLASRLSTAALLSGQTPEAVLREAISQWIESTAPARAAARKPDSSFSPQPQRFSVYE